MIINGNYYPQTANNTTKGAETDPVESLATHMTGKEQKASLSDKVELSPEAYAALKEYAPEALQVMGYGDNPILEEAKEIAKEKFFQFGTQYLNIPATEPEMISALEVANRYMDALNSIEPDEIYEAVADANREDSGDFIQMANRYGAASLIG